MSVIQIFFTVGILGFFTISLAIWVYCKLPKSSAKFGIIGFSVFYLIWMCLLYLTNYPSLDLNIFGIISRTIFISGALMIAFFCHFSVSLSNPSELKSIRYWMLQGNMVLLLLCIFMGLVEDGVQETEKGFLPILGPLYFYNTISLIAIGLYALIVLAYSYWKTKNEFLHYQLESILYSGIATFLGLMVSANVLPIIFDKPELVMSGGVWPLFLFTGISYVMVHGRSLYVKKAFAKLLKQPAMNNDENFSNMRELVRWVDMVVNDNPEKSHKKIRFKCSDEEIEFDASKGIIENNEQANQLEIKNSILKGIVANSDLVYQENQRLSFAVMKAEKLLNESIYEPIEATTQSLMSRNDESLVYVKNYEASIKKNIAENEDAYQQKFICFSKNQYNALLELEKELKVSAKLVIEGGAGVGKSTYAKALYYKVYSRSLHQIHCSNLSFKELSQQIDGFMRASANGSNAGLLFRQIDELDADAYMALDRVLSQNAFHVLFTTSIPVERIFAESEHRIANQIKYISVVKMPPLAERNEDVFHAVLSYVLKYNEITGSKITSISSAAMQELLSYKLDCGYPQLESIIKSTLINTSGDHIEAFKVEKQPVALEDDILIDKGTSELSDLEYVEMVVIDRCLKKNDYNKTKTKNELRITINTLNAKIKKYNLQMSESQ